MLPAALPPPPDAFYQLSPAEERRVEQGEIVVHAEDMPDPVKRTLIEGLVDAPPAITYRVYTDFGHYREIFQIDDSEVLSRQGNTLYGKFVVDFPWPIGERWTDNLTVLSPADRSFTFRRVAGNFRLYQGSLRVLPEGASRSRVIYTAQVDPSLPVPSWLLNMVQSQIFPSVIGAVRTAVKDPAYRSARDAAR